MATDQELEDLGFEKRYRLVGHPAYPDPLVIHPPTAEHAAEIHRQYCGSFEDYVEKLNYVPKHWSGKPLTAETFNPRILIDWVFVGEPTIFTPED